MHPRPLDEQADSVGVEADPCELLQPEAAAREIDRCLGAALTAVRDGKDAVITTGYNGDSVNRVGEKARAQHLSLRQASEGIAAALGDLCRRIATGAALSGLVLTGGDVAEGCCGSLSAAGFTIVGEVAPGIPLGRIEGGPFDGLRVVTKAGAFGGDDALCAAVDCLKRDRLPEREEPERKEKGIP